jgi:hypothetical protein
MAHDLGTIEKLRASFRPNQITTLLVGESAPVSGEFFYVGDTALKRYMQRLVDDALGKSELPFLGRFRSFGWFLDDLVLTPVNHLGKTERLLQCERAQGSLAVRIAEYRPRAIVSLLKSIQRWSMLRPSRRAATFPDMLCRLRALGSRVALWLRWQRLFRRFLDCRRDDLHRPSAHEMEHIRDVAKEIRRRCDLRLSDVPSGLQDFCDRFDRYRDVQLLLPIRLM